MLDASTNTDRMLKGIILEEWEKKRIDFPLQSYDDASRFIRHALDNYPNVTQKSIAEELGSSQSEILKWLGSEKQLRICLTSRIIIYLNEPIQERIINHRVPSESLERNTTDFTQDNVSEHVDNVENKKDE